MFGFKIITQCERGVVFRFGQVLSGTRAPGLTWVNPFTDRLRKVNMQIVVVAVPAQEAITLDNVTVRVDAVVYYRVVDPVKAIINVQDYHHAVSQVAQTSLRSVIGQNDLDQLLSGREKINAHLKDVIDAPTEEPWGILVERVELKDISLPESMKRSMSRQAEAERERRARVIAADGEYQASTRLAEAATVMAADPAALQLRLLQTVVEVAAEKNSTLVMPFPVELLRFFDNAAQSQGRVQAAAADARTADDSPQAAGVPALTATSLPAGVSLAGQLNGIAKAPAGQRMLPGKPGPKRACRATVECAKAPPARISAATQMASMISSIARARRRRASLVWPLMQYGHWVTCAAATAISCLVLGGQGAVGEHLPAERVERLMDRRGELTAAVTDLAGSRRIDHAGHDRIPFLAAAIAVCAPGLPELMAADLIPRSCPGEVADCLRVHDPGHVVDERLVLPGPAQQVEAHLLARADPRGGDHPAGVRPPGTADVAGRRLVGQPVDRHHPGRPRLAAVRLLAARGRQPVEQARPGQDPRAGAHARQQCFAGMPRMNACSRVLQVSRAGPCPARDQKRVRRRSASKTILAAAPCG